VIVIREFASSDARALFKIEHASHPAGHWRAEDYEWLRRQPEGIVLVAETAGDGAIAGFVAARAMGPEAEMLNLAVDPDHRRQGVGRSLVQALHRQLHAGGTERVYLEVRPSNLAAQQLYRSLGYAECGRRRDYYASNGEDALVLEIRLGAACGAGASGPSRRQGSDADEIP
jgi:[ribosomal protein S18]-alanine N-acetyltransferase